MPEENKNQNRDLSQIRLELIALLTQRKKLAFSVKITISYRRIYYIEIWLWKSFAFRL